MCLGMQQTFDLDSFRLPNNFEHSYSRITKGSRIPSIDTKDCDLGCVTHVTNCLSKDHGFQIGRIIESWCVGYFLEQDQTQEPIISRDSRRLPLRDQSHTLIELLNTAVYRDVSSSRILNLA
jgi:hypothetical protein